MSGEETPKPVQLALSLGHVLVAWTALIGVDLFFNAGLFTNLWDQAREPSLLPDAVLATRIPVAYLTFLVAVVALAWLVDREDRQGAAAGAKFGVVAGAVFASMGIIGLWTAIDMTGLFVAAGAVVLVVEMGAAGAVLGAYRAGRERVGVWSIGAAVALAVSGLVIQNLV